MTEDARQAPYPAATRSKGWRFELDMERIRSSDTWALTPATFRPWLLMLWAVAWEQTPCGSLPNNDELIAAHLGMDAEAFAAARGRLLRGWWLADDGRLYHPTITERVLEMLDKRARETNRKAAQRGRRNPPGSASVTTESTDVPSVSHGTTKGLPQDSTRSHGTSTSTSYSVVPTGTTGDLPAAAPPDPSADPPPDPIKAFFDAGLALLKADSRSDTAKRQMLGKLRKARGDTDAMQVLLAARNKSDPWGYIAASSQPQSPRLVL